jgi:hypothetical protein
MFNVWQPIVPFESVKNDHTGQEARQALRWLGTG